MSHFAQILELKAIGIIRILFLLHVTYSIIFVYPSDLSPTSHATRVSLFYTIAPIYPNK